MNELQIDSRARYRPPLVRLTILAIGCFVALRGVAGFYYETNDDPIMEMIFRRVLFPAARGPEIGLAHLLTASVMGRLYRVAPSVAWYGVTMYLLLLAAVIGIVVSVDDALGRPTRSWLRMVALTSFAFIFLSENIVLLEFTRVAVLLGGSSILLIACAIQYPTTSRRCLVAGAVILFGLAALTRPDGALLSLTTTGPFVLLAAPRRGLKTLVLSLVGLSLLALAAQGCANHQERRYRTVYAYLGNLVDFGWHRGGRLSLDDSLRFRAARLFLTSDPEVIDLHFLARVSSPAVFDPGKLSRRRIETSLRGFKAQISAGGWLLVAASASVFPLALLRGRGLAKRLILRHAVGHAVFWLAAASIAIFMQVPPRVLSPLVALYACANVSTLAALGPPAIRGATRVAWAAITVGASIGVAATASEMISTVVLHREASQNNEQFLTRVRDEVNSPVVILLPGLRSFKALDPLKGVPLEAGKNHYVLLSGWPCLLDAFEKEAEAIAASKRFPDLIAALAGSGAFALSDNVYNEFLVDYLAKVHNLQVTFRRSAPQLRAETGLQKRAVKLYAVSVTSYAPGSGR